MLRWTTLVLVLLAVSASPAAAEPVVLPSTKVPAPAPLLQGGSASPAALKLLGTSVVQELNRVRAAR